MNEDSRGQFLRAYASRQRASQNRQRSSEIAAEAVHPGDLSRKVREVIDKAAD
jgi:hypothetical protein